MHAALNETAANNPKTAKAAARIGYAIFWVTDASAAARFFEESFGFARKVEMKTAITPWIELDAGAGLSLAFAEFSEADVLFSAGYRRHAADEAPVASAIAVSTEDVDGAYARSIENGARSLQAPRKEPWGQTVARVRTPDGLVVSMATPISFNA